MEQFLVYQWNKNMSIQSKGFPFFLDTISKTFTVNNIKKAVLNGYVYGSL